MRDGKFGSPGPPGHAEPLARGMPRGGPEARDGGDDGRVRQTGAFGVGQIVGPALAGAASDATGGFAVPSLAAAVALVAAAWLGRG